MPQVWTRLERLNVMRLQASANLAAVLACVMVALEYRCAPFPVFRRTMLVAMPQMVGSRLRPSFSFQLRGNLPFPARIVTFLATEHLTHSCLLRNELSTALFTDQRPALVTPFLWA